MRVRKIQEEELLESLKLSMYAFQYEVKEEDIPNRIMKAKQHNILSIWDEEKLAAKLHIIPLSIYINGKVQQMGGVAGVATYPEYRRLGYVKELITEALKEMKDKGQILSLLHPFDIGFYRKYGWEVFADNKKTIIESKDLKILPVTEGTIKRYTKDLHCSLIENLYSKVASKYAGALVRSTDWWINNVYSDYQIAVYFNRNGEEKGYILFKVKDKLMDVQEMVTLDHEAARGLWNFICQHDSMVDKVKVMTSMHDSFPYYLHQPKVSMEVIPYFMSRIVDVEKFLRAYNFLSTNEQVFLHVTDPYASWNSCTFLIKDGEVKAFREKEGSSCTHPPKVGIQMSVNDLTAITFGYKRPIELYEMEKIKGRLEDVMALEKKVPPLKPFFYDFF
ncbi:enhanced intracellular survival protein Eis [Cytobacillus sp. FJAT-54145]|uniref:Enhanced intracellular survival protein Eis n=1 Tax=Cytobacillus spartinae TaxID=3299023 RepID=A0ABW6KJC2_9BACI